MKRSLKVAFILSTCFVVIGILLTAVSLRFFPWNSIRVEDQQEITVTEIQEPFDALHLDIVEADIRFEIGATAKIAYRNFDHVIYAAEVQDGVLNLYQADKRPTVEKLFDFIHKNQEILITLPAKTYQRLWLRTVSGDVTLPGNLKITETILESTSGDLTLDGLAGDSLSVLTTSGDIEMYRTVLTQKMDLETTSGDIEAEASDAPEILIDTTSGDVEATWLTEKKFLIDTTSGEREVPPSAETRETCTVKTVSGDIEISIKWLDELN